MQFVVARILRSCDCTLMDINISLPDEIRVYIEAQITTGAYGSISEYFLDLVQRDQKCKAREKLEALLLEGLNSDVQEVTPEFWQCLRESVLSLDRSGATGNPDG